MRTAAAAAAAADEFSPSWNLIQSGSDVQLVSFSLVVRRTYVRHASAPSQHVCASPLVNFKAVAPTGKWYFKFHGFVCVDIG